MTEKPPKDPAEYGKVIDFKTGKVIPNPQETYQPKPPEITIDEAKEMFQKIFDNFEPKVWHLHGLAEKAREKFDAYEHLVFSGQYSEERYRSYVSQLQPHRLGSKLGRKREIPQIFSEDEKWLYGKINEYEKEVNDYLRNFLIDQEALDNELTSAYSHLKNIKGAEESKEKLEKYLKKINFDFTSFVFMGNNLEGYRKKIEAIEEFVKKLVN